MTVKPIAKRTTGNSSEADKEGHQNTVSGVSTDVVNQSGHVTSNRTTGSLGPLNHRNVVIDSKGKSPQQRVDVYDELVRHRSSGNKSSRPKRREIMQNEHLKRNWAHNDERNNISNDQVDVHCSNNHMSAAGGTSSTVSNSASSVCSGLSTEKRKLESLNVNLNPKSHPSSAHSASTKITNKNVSDNFSGYNSGDEYARTKDSRLTPSQWRERDEQFIKCMTERGFVVKQVEEDGACLFRSISLQIYGDEDMHDVIRQNTMDYIYKNREYFSHFVTENIESYIARKRRNDSHGNHIEIQAMSEIYNRPVEVYCYQPTPINIFNSEQLRNGFAPLRLSYQHGSHYNAIIDPYNATVGVGLGLAGYQPELQTTEALRLSEKLEIEQTMFEDKLKTTDWEATNEAIEEQIARESYLQWCRDNLQKSRTDVTATITGATISSTITSEKVIDEEIKLIKISKEISVKQEKGHNDPILKSAVNASNISSEINSTLMQTINTEDCCSSVLSNTGIGNDREIHFGNNDDIDSKTSDGDISSLSPSRSKRYRKTAKKTVNIAFNKKQRCTSKENCSDLEENASLSVEPNDIVLENEGYKQQRSQTPDFEQQKPCTSKKSNISSNVKCQHKTDGGILNRAIQSDVPISTFYQELLEASYSSDGLRQMSESEMLQRAIQMSTHDYIEDQKKKFFCGK